MLFSSAVSSLLTNSLRRHHPMYQICRQQSDFHDQSPDEFFPALLIFRSEIMKNTAIASSRILLQRLVVDDTAAAGP